MGHAGRLAGDCQGACVTRMQTQTQRKLPITFAICVTGAQGCAGRSARGRSGCASAGGAVPAAPARAPAAQAPGGDARAVHPGHGGSACGRGRRASAPRARQHGAGAQHSLGPCSPLIPWTLCCGCPSRAGNAWRRCWGSSACYACAACGRGRCAPAPCVASIARVPGQHGALQQQLARLAVRRRTACRPRGVILRHGQVGFLCVPLTLPSLHLCL